MGTLQFVIGKASRQHEAALVEDLIQRLQDPKQSKDRFFFLVPNHIKFETEVRILATLQSRLGYREQYAQSRVQILSFSRLAWYLLKNDPAYQSPRLSKMGPVMLVAQIIQQLKQTNPQQLGIFQGESDRPGFVQAVTEQIIAFQTANLTPDDLIDQPDSVVAQALQSQHQSPSQEIWLEKLRIISQIYERYLTLSADRLSNVDIEDLLVQKLHDPQVSHDHFYLDRYTGQFSAKEQAIVEVMIQNGASTMMSLVADRAYAPHELPDEHNLYYQSAAQYQRLITFVDQQTKVDLLPPIMGAQLPLRVGNDLLAVETWMEAQAQFQTPEVKVDFQGQVSFLVTPTRLAEVDQIAAKIRQLVATKGYRYRDFLILTRHLASYENIIEPIFKRHQIPLFIDHQRSMANSPLVTMIEALFKIKQNYYQTADVMQLLKTELLTPQDVEHATFMEAVYQTENWCLKYGQGGKAWLRKAWQPIANESADLMITINQVRQYISREIAPFLDQLDQITTGRELATALYQFLVQQGVDQALLKWSQAALEAGDLTLMEQPQQVWQTFCNLLDEYVDLVGELTNEPKELLEEFIAMIEAAFGAAEYSQIPSTLDQVMISETGMAQTNQRSVVIMMGSTDDVMPEIKMTTGLLSDPDLDLLRQGLKADQFLPLSDVARSNHEPFINYLGMLSGTQRLIMTAAQLSSDESELTLSPYLIGLAQHLGQWDSNHQMVLGTQPAQIKPQAEFEQILPVISTPAVSMAYLLATRRLQADDQTWLSDGWQSLAVELNQLMPGRYQHLMASLDYHNQTTNLPAPLAVKLYGQPLGDDSHGQLMGSVSQLQTFYQNPYEYFLKYGLRLQPRDELEISIDKSGTFFHDVMDQFMRLVKQQSVDLADLVDDEALLKTLTDQAIQVAKTKQASVMELAKNDQVAAYQVYSMEKVARTMTRILSLQAQHSDARAVAMEQPFGPRVTRPGDDNQVVLTPLQQQLPNGKVVTLRGRIDRIDQVVTDQGTDYVIVDYKSSERKFDLIDAYVGNDLQMLAYLDVVQQNLSNGRAAGAIYLHLSDPQYKETDLKKNLTTVSLENHIYKGILLNQEAFLTSLDDGLTSKSPKGLVIDVNKLGKPKPGLNRSEQNNFQAKAGTSLVSFDQLEWLIKRNRWLIHQAASEILAGNVALLPVRRGAHSGLEYSDYLDIYQFDQMLDRYREITIDEDELIKKMQAELEGDHE